MAKVEVRCTTKEKAKWSAKAEAAGMSLSALVREAMDRVRTWSVSDRMAYAERTREIAMIGNNLNNISRWCMAQQPSAMATMRVLAALIVIHREIEEKADAYQGSEVR